MNKTTLLLNECPDCDGLGAFSHDYSRAVRKSEPRSKACSMCHGTGYIETAITTTNVSALADFIRNHPKTWNVVTSEAPNFMLSSFSYDQDRGSWVLYGNPGEAIRFRMYQESVVAVILPSRVFVLVNGEYIAA